MKKHIILIAIILISVSTTKLVAQKNRTLSNGFSLNLIVGVPAGTYGLTSDNKFDGYAMGTEYKFNSSFGIQIGNRWYIHPQEKYGFGIMVNWADISMALKTDTHNGDQWARAAFDISFIEFGPVATIVLADNLALDAYYNLRPTVFSNAMVWNYASSGSADETYAYVGFGVSHAIGAALRYKIFNLGMEYVMGSINCTGAYSGSAADETLENQKYMTNCFRLKLGLKF